MPPVLLLLGFGERAWIPFPLILLWPIVGSVWLMLLLLEPFFLWRGSGVRIGLATGRCAIRMFTRLSGFRVDVEREQGCGLNVWIV